MPTPRVRAVVFDVDGVMTRTATVHARAWKAMFDDLLRDRSARSGEPFVAFDDDDYRRFVDGIPRYDGVRRFLASRHVELPEGAPDDPPELDTVHGLGNRKNAVFVSEVETHGVEPFRSTAALLADLQRLGIGRAAVSASENAGQVLRAAGLDGLVDLRVDGVDAKQLGLAGKPDPALFLEAARRLGVAPERRRGGRGRAAGRGGRAAGRLRPGGRRRSQRARRGAGRPRARTWWSTIWRRSRSMRRAGGRWIVG